MMRGLPASGKTTYAKELVAQGYKRVNKDDLRAMIDNSKWSRDKEKIIFDIEKNLVFRFLRDGFNVVVDDTNFAHEAEWDMIAKTCESTFEIKDFNTPVHECVRRNLLRGETVPTDAIWKMYRQYVQPNIKRPGYNKDLPDSYLVDIDGTLAHMTKRSPFEWDRVDEDTLDEYVAHLVDYCKAKGNKIFILSGRDSVCREKTLTWLNDYNIPFDELYMRPAGDKRPDTEVKKELYENNIKGKANILGVFDDRDSVVNLWRSLGLKCFQCEPGAF